MYHVKRELVASGVIGVYNHEWKIWKHPNRDRYDLVIKTESYGSFHSIVDALRVLVETFEST